MRGVRVRGMRGCQSPGYEGVLESGVRGEVRVRDISYNITTRKYVVQNI